MLTDHEKRKAWEYAVKQKFQDVVTNGFDPLTLYQCMGEYEDALSAIELSKKVLADNEIGALVIKNQV